MIKTDYSSVRVERPFIVLPIENSRSCVGKRLYNNRLWFCSRESTTLKGILDQIRLEGKVL
jgi:hypothetical protein